MPLARSILRKGTGPAASVLVGSASAGVLRLVSSVTLTRLLDSHAYGVVGILLAISSMLNLVSDIGMNQFILRHQRGDERDFLDELWTLQLVRAVLLAAVTALLAQPAARMLGKPELAPVLAVWGLSFLIAGLGSLASASAIRSGRLWRLSLLDLCGNLAAFVCSLAGALLLHSYWALVAGMLLGAAVKSIASHLLFPAARPRLRFSRARSRELWGFSRNIALSSAMTMLIAQTDKLVLARLMPLATFGLYAIAVTLTLSAGHIANSYAGRVLAGTYAKVARNDPARLKQVFYATRRRLPLLQMGAIGAMIGAAPLMIAILYDARFAGVTPFFQLLAIGAALRIPVLAAQNALIALGTTRTSVTANAVRMLWLALAAAVGFASGNVLAMVALVGTIEVPALLCIWRDLRRHHLLDLREEALGIAVIVAGAAIGHVAGVIGLALLRSL